MSIDRLYKFGSRLVEVEVDMDDLVQNLDCGSVADMLDFVVREDYCPKGTVPEICMNIGSRDVKN
jgi:hypothetical protein